MCVRSAFTGVLFGNGKHVIEDLAARHEIVSGQTIQRVSGLVSCQSFLNVTHCYLISHPHNNCILQVLVCFIENVMPFQTIVFNVHYGDRQRGLGCRWCLGCDGEHCRYGCCDKGGGYNAERTQRCREDVGTWEDVEGRGEDTRRHREDIMNAARNPASCLPCLRLAQVRRLPKTRSEHEFPYNFVSLLPHPTPLPPLPSIPSWVHHLRTSAPATMQTCTGSSKDPVHCPCHRFAPKPPPKDSRCDSCGHRRSAHQDNAPSVGGDKYVKQLLKNMAATAVHEEARKETLQGFRPREPVRIFPFPFP